MARGRTKQWGGPIILEKSNCSDRGGGGCWGGKMIKKIRGRSKESTQFTRLPIEGKAEEKNFSSRMEKEGG